MRGPRRQPRRAAATGQCPTSHSRGGRPPCLPAQTHGGEPNHINETCRSRTSCRALVRLPADRVVTRLGRALARSASMESYLLIASRDPFTARDVDGFYALAASLAARGHPVTVFLVQNGVLAARRVSAAEPLTRLAPSAVAVLADELSVRERGTAEERRAAGLRAGP